jgi:aminoglycoside phosphotransferase (APT) family kinase protein
MRSSLSWVEKVLGRTVRDQQAMAGATSSEVYRIVVSGGQSVVLRLFTNQEWLATEPDLAGHEAAALEAVAASNLPTPGLLAVDETGAEAGVPAVLMTELPGSVMVDPPDRELWLDGMAGALAHLHSLEVSRFPWSYRVWQDLERLTVPGWSTNPARWETAIDRIRRDFPASQVGFIHRDFHPTNVLWSAGTVSGVVDWVNACRGPTGVDVAHCRLNLAAMSGPETANGFSARYETLTGRSHDPFWDLVATVEWLPGAQVYPPWLDFGLVDLDTPLVHARVEAFIGEALARV